MEIFTYIMMGLLIASGLFLVVAVLLQQGKDKSLSSSIAGGSADTYFGKSGGSTKEKILTRFTIAGSILFVVLSVVLMILISKG